MRLALCLAITVASPVSALEICDELWFTRNLVFDRAGYCFGSALGKAIFDNSGCTTKSPSLSGAHKDVVARVKEIEAEWSCGIDTSRQRLGVEAIDLKRQLLTTPVPHGYESSCIGWRGDDVPLRMGASGSAPIVASFGAGDNLLFEHLPENGFSFVSVYEDGGLKALGWGRFDESESACEAWAG